MSDLKTLTEKWDDTLNESSEAPIADDYRTKVTAQLLENQEKTLMENPTNVTAGVDGWDPVLMKLVRRAMPKMIAFDVCGVQPMQMPTGLIFALRARYGNQAGAEALHDEANTAHGGTGNHVGSDPFDPLYETGAGLPTATGETQDPWNEMSVTIDKVSVTAVTHQLRASYSIELRQDMKAVHGLDADREIANILSTEVMSEVNRVVVRTIYGVAKLGAQTAGTPGTFDLVADSDGRWSVEKFKGLVFQIERDANQIAIETRRGKGNFIICSSDVASALAMAGVLDHSPALEAQTKLAVDPTGTTFAGTIRGTVKVFIDPYATGDFYVVGYKGANAYDAGIYFAPYTPLELYRATLERSFSPSLGFKTRYGIVANPFSTMNAGQNQYYRKVKVTNLL